MYRPTFQNINVLSTAECEQVQHDVMALRLRWMDRHPTLPFHTLGAASYLDAVGESPAYARLAREYNPLLKAHFTWLYDRVASALANALGAPTAHAEPLGLPGFHIFLSDKAFEQPLASVHYDLQYLLHDWSSHEADLGDPISFTLAIALPRHGGGLRTWDVSNDERRAYADKLPEELAHSRPVTHHAYERGHMALHSGHLLHQIAPAVDLLPDDRRITLQGHGVRVGGIWRLYW